MAAQDRLAPLVEAAGPLRLCVDPERGRYLEAGTDLDAGQVILQAPPLLVSTAAPDMCIGCGRTHSVVPSQPCSGLTKLFSGAPALIGLQSSVEKMLQHPLVGLGAGSDTIAKARLLLLALAELVPDIQAKTKTSALWWLLELSRPAEPAPRLRTAFSALSDMLTRLGLSPTAVADLVEIFNTNAVDLPGIGGAGIYLLPSLINHSCSPNALWYATTPSSGTEFVLRTVDPIPAGTEISISYLSLLKAYAPTAVRRRYLVASHKFVCQCPRCAGPLRDLARVFLCPSCSAPSLTPLGEDKDWYCSACCRRPSAEAIQALVDREASFVSAFDRARSTAADEEEAWAELSSRSLEASPLAKQHWVRFRVLDAIVSRERATTRRAVQRRLGDITRLLDNIRVVAPQYLEHLSDYVVIYAQLAAALQLPATPDAWMLCSQLARSTRGPEDVMVGRYASLAKLQVTTPIEDVYAPLLNDIAAGGAAVANLLANPRQNRFLRRQFYFLDIKIQPDGKLSIASRLKKHSTSPAPVLDRQGRPRRSHSGHRSASRSVSRPLQGSQSRNRPRNPSIAASPSVAQEGSPDPPPAPEADLADVAEDLSPEPTPVLSAAEISAMEAELAGIAAEQRALSQKAENWLKKQQSELVAAQEALRSYKSARPSTAPAAAPADSSDDELPPLEPIQSQQHFDSGRLSRSRPHAASSTPESDSDDDDGLPPLADAGPPAVF